MSEGRRFQLLRRLGAGGHGEVYLAEQESQAGFRRRVALKVLRPELGTEDEAAIRMRDEARILGRLSHRHIVGVSDLVRLDDRWAVVMDYVPGADLDRVLHALRTDAERFPPRAGLEAAVAILRALHAAWNVDNGEGRPLQLIHRDIKPSNVLLAQDGALKVLDFGVARVDMGTREAKTGQVRFGTLRYMAPERLIGEEETPAGDVYATGVSILELFVGEPLGRTPVVEPKHSEWVAASVEKAATVAPDNEPFLKAIDALGHAMAAEPGDRPSAEDLASTLAELAPHAPGEDLHAFALRYVPRVTEILGDTSEPVTGTLHEVSSMAAATYIGPDAPVDFGEPEAEDRSGVSMGIIAAVAVGVVLVAVICVGSVAIGGLASGAWLGSTPPSVDAGLAGTEEDPAEDDPAGDATLAADTDTLDEGEVDTDSEDGADTDAAPAADTDVPAPEAPSSGGASPASGTASGSPTTGSSNGATAVSTPAPTPPIDPDAPRVSAAMFAMTDASSLSVTCGDVSRVGTASVRLRNLPAGSCTVKATYLGQQYVTSVEVRSRREVRCALTDGSLACR